MRVNLRVIVIIVAAIVLVGSLVYLTLLIQDGSNPLGMFGIRASNPQDEQDPFLTENQVSPIPTTANQTLDTPTPTEVLIAYNSTSPTPVPATGSANLATPEATLTVSLSPSPTITITPTPTVDPIALALTESITPTPVAQLPVSGVTDNVNKIFIGGGFLILLGLLL